MSLDRFHKNSRPAESHWSKDRLTRAWTFYICFSCRKIRQENDNVWPLHVLSLAIRIWVSYLRSLLMGRNRADHISHLHFLFIGRHDILPEIQRWLWVGISVWNFPKTKVGKVDREKGSSEGTWNAQRVQTLTWAGLSMSLKSLINSQRNWLPFSHSLQKNDLMYCPWSLLSRRANPQNFKLVFHWRLLNFHFLCNLHLG